MASKRTLRLREIQPRDRVVVSHPYPFPSRAERRRNQAKHSRRMLRSDGELVLLRMTDRRPWTKRGRARLRNRLARTARKAGR